MYPILRQRGASTAELSVSAVFLLLLGLGTLQMGLLFHARSVVNYATFEAARTGAVANARIGPMREELGRRLAPLEGGDGSHEAAAEALSRSALRVRDASNTRIEILNPTVEAFSDWGVYSPRHQRDVLPNAHLRHREHRIGTASGLSLQDANLLKIRVRHGVPLSVPIAGDMIAWAMARIDSANVHWYARGLMPIESVATVRMQSEAFEDDVTTSASAPVPGNTVAPVADAASSPLVPVASDAPSADPGNGRDWLDAERDPFSFTSGYEGNAPQHEDGTRAEETAIDANTPTSSDASDDASGAVSPVDAVSAVECINGLDPVTDLVTTEDYENGAICPVNSGLHSESPGGASGVGRC